MSPNALQAAPIVRVVVRRTSIAGLLALLYRQSPPALRVDMLSQLLRPVGPLALVAIAAGAFGRLLPPTRWQGVQVNVDDTQHFSAQQVYELVRYVEQKSPELLAQLPQLVADPRLWLGSATGALLLLVLRQRKR